MRMAWLYFFTLSKENACPQPKKLLSNQWECHTVLDLSLQLIVVLIDTRLRTHRRTLTTIQAIVMLISQAVILRLGLLRY
jgi:hypothetical protein